MQNNFDIVEELLNREPFLIEDNMYVFVQIIARNKDVDLPHGKGVKQFYIFRNLSDILKKKSEIIELCILFNARAYINIVPCYYDNLIKNVQYRLSYSQFSNNDINLLGTIASASATSKPKHKYFMIDVDNDSTYERDDITDYLGKEGISIHATLPTVNGLHIITDRFDRIKFAEIFDVDIKKDVATLLFAP